MIEEIKKEYEEFLEVTKLENESFKTAQQNEYDRLREEFDQYKHLQFDERKKLLVESQNLLYSMQTQFDEYRTTSEFMFNVEVSQLQEELTSQAQRYEQEIMHIIQSKDKFYEDMTVAKDAKIMSLVEGSDLQSVLQKHEQDIENLRKDHVKELERLKSEQESEQKNLITVLQRDNVNLETKAERLTGTIKTLELKIKDLYNTIEMKNRHLLDKEEQRGKLEFEFQKQLEQANLKNNVLSQEKEHLRHKVIRMKLAAKGEGDNSIENMMKRIARETAELHTRYETLALRQDTTNTENTDLIKRLREKEKISAFLEKEMARRNDDITKLVYLLPFVRCDYIRLQHSRPSLNRGGDTLRATI